MGVWEWCRNVWCSNLASCHFYNFWVWEWCRNVWCSNSKLYLFPSVKFENDVEMYGAQTCNTVKSVAIEFENDVEMYGAQTTLILTEDTVGLRMM